MNIIETEISGLLILEPKVYSDDRGYFYESFNLEKFNQQTGENVVFVQDNHSRSNQNVLRGLHYQISPHAQGKLVRVVHGAVYDVAVDLRKDSDTFGKWLGVELTQGNKRQLWLPEGFAHGFVVLSEYAEFLYKTTSYYSPEFERSIIWNDPELGIKWPMSKPKLSEKDKTAPRFKDIDIEELSV